MAKPNLDALFDEEEGESKLTIEAGSQAVVPKMSTTVSGKVISPIPMNPADMAKMLALGKDKFSVYQSMVNDLVHEADSLVVQDQDSHDKSVMLGLRAKKLGKEITEKEKSFTKHASDFVKGLRSFIKPFTDGCDKIERITKDKNRDWMALRELERRKQQKILEDAQRAVQARVDEEAKAAGIESVQIQPAIVKEEEKTITRTESGSAHLRAVKDCKVVNLSLVPREYLERVVSKDPDKFLRPIILDELKKNPELEVSGVLIFDSTSIIYRT